MGGLWRWWSHIRPSVLQHTRGRPVAYMRMYTGVCTIRQRATGAHRRRPRPSPRGLYAQAHRRESSMQRPPARRRDDAPARTHTRGASRRESRQMPPDHDTPGTGGALAQLGYNLDASLRCATDAASKLWGESAINKTCAEGAQRVRLREGTLAHALWNHASQGQPRIRLTGCRNCLLASPSHPDDTQSR